MNISRDFIAKKQKINTWEDIKPYLENLKSREINSADDLIKWWKDRSETDAFLEEDMAWRYIKMSCNTTDKKLSDSFNFFVAEIEPKVSEYSDILDKKFINSEFINHIDSEKYFIPIRAIKKNIELFRKENIPLFAEMQQKEQEYGNAAAKMTISYDNEEMTLQKAANFLKKTDRNIRKEVYTLINERRLQDKDKLNDLLTELISIRHKIAENVGFKNFRDYKFEALHRFDYNVDDCITFQNSIKETVTPIVDAIYRRRKAKLALNNLKPFDLDVDEELKEPLMPFKTSEELLEKSIEVFSRIRPKYGEFLKIMDKNGYLDLESRKGKSPGGFNYPLYESNIPFIFTNATGNLRDVETLMHEGGHAIHSFLSSDLELVDFKGLTSEIAELASMSMELISMSEWDVFFENEEDLKRAKRHQLEGILNVLPWIATVDKFQHLLYLAPNHTPEMREEMWRNTAKEFGSSQIDWKSYEKYFDNTWQKQLHIFEVPFYYIEYGFAQLGAIAVWRNFIKNKEKALDDYENALKLGYSKTISEIYKTAGIEFDFSKKYIGELMDFVKNELEKLK